MRAIRIVICAAFVTTIVAGPGTATAAESAASSPPASPDWCIGIDWGTGSCWGVFAGGEMCAGAWDPTSGCLGVRVPKNPIN